MKRHESLIGQKFGRLEVLSLSEGKVKDVIASCKCECGREHKASLCNLRQGKVRSCGCLRKENIKMFARNMANSFKITQEKRSSKRKEG